MEMLRGCEPTRQVQQLISRCREIDPLLRPTAAEVVRDLSNIAPTQAAPPPHEAPTLREQRRERTLAVLRPTVLGQAIDPAVAEAFTAELIDALTRCHELKVTGLGAVARFADARDPHQIGRELRVELVVDPTLMIVGDRVRVDARVLEVHSGFQVFRGRFEDGLDGLLQLQEAIAARIAEALRVAIIAATSRGSAPGEVMGLYLKARSALNRFDLSGPNGALALLDACLAKAPYFKPGLACQAHARVRAWFAPQTLTSDLESRAREAVEQCLEHAPELPESQLSAALWQTQLGNYREAVMALNRALSAAPMCAPAHELLALLELESGRLHEGLERGRMALSLDPTLTATWVMLGLREALVSRDAFERWTAQPPGELRDSLQLKAMRLRAGVWFRDRDLQRAAVEELRGKGPLASDLWLLYGAVAAGQQTSDLNATMARLEQQLGANPRRGSFWCALLVEAFASSGRVKEALVWLERASQMPLLDLDWMLRCPCLEQVRAAPAFEAIRERVQQRVDQVWA
ncbi:MAG: hypothetical protein QM723_02660 [Myxococcaceae bacterium]